MNPRIIFTLVVNLYASLRFLDEVKRKRKIIINKTENPVLRMMRNREMNGL